MINRIFVLFAASLFLSASLHSQESPAKKEVWMMPPGPGPGPGEPPTLLALRDFYLHPDDWKQTRAAMTAKTVGVFASSPYKITKVFTPDEMRQFGQMLKGWNIRFGLEIESVRGTPDWRTGQDAFDRQYKEFDNIQANGLPIYGFAMDGPYCSVVYQNHRSRDEAIRETANFIALMRKHYPNARIGDIEPYPTLTVPELVSWVKDLQAKLKEMNVRGIDFLRLDFNWTHVMLGDQGNWRDVKRLEMACREIGVPFSLIYWAPPYGSFRRLGIADDSTWYTCVIWQGYSYALVNGSPDQYVLESWIGTPSAGTPETNPDSFARSVLDFCNKFVLKPMTPSGL